MKIQKTNAVCVLLMMCYFTTSAQQQQQASSQAHLQVSTQQKHVFPVNEPDHNKPKLFADLPNQMEVKTPDLESLLDLAVGTQVNKQLASQFHFVGTVVSKSDAQDISSKSIVIKSLNRQGATLTISKVKNDDGTFSFIGRIMSFKHGDAYEIALENGNYQLKKKDLYDLFNE